MSNSSPAWSKSAKHLMREAAVQDLTESWEPGLFAEFGVGTGAMTQLFVERGFKGMVHDIGSETRAALRRGTFRPGGPVEVVDDRDEVLDNSVDYLLAFEVLEHVPNDAEVLSNWTRVLKDGGRVLITVPAHMHKFSDTDRRVGHVRRYEREGLESLLTACGIDDIRIVNYGYPLGNLSRAVMSRLEAADVHDVAEGQLERSVRSGVEQPRLVNALSRVVNKHTIKPFTTLQRRYFDGERGDGYVAIGTRRR